MGPFLRTPVRQLSLGQRMRGDFAAAMLHDPRVVFLDEPTIGLDVVAKEAIREFIARVNRERGTTFILTTHDLADVERLCRRIVLIDRGTLVYDGEIDALRDRYGTHRTLVVTLCEPVPVETIERRRGGGGVARRRRLAAALRPPHGLGGGRDPAGRRPLLRERPLDRGARARIDHSPDLPRGLQRDYGTRVMSCGWAFVPSTPIDDR